MNRQQRRQQDRQRAKAGSISPPELPATPELSPEGRHQLDRLAAGTAKLEDLRALDPGEAVAVVAHYDEWLARYLVYMDHENAVVQRAMQQATRAADVERRRQQLAEGQAMRERMAAIEAQIRALFPAP